MRALVTAFEPMADWLINASEQVVRDLEESKPSFPGLSQLDCRVLPAVAENLEQELLTQFSERSPDVCLFVGQAASANCILLERFALNHLHFSKADASGATYEHQSIVPGEVLARESTLGDLTGLSMSLNQKGIPTRVSVHAGTSLCNQLLYLGLHHASEGMRVGFVHIPVIMEQLAEDFPSSAALPREVSTRAIEILLEELCR